MARLAILMAMLWGIFPLQAHAGAQRRVALVVGNATYEDAGTLANPVNDATDIAAKLRAVGFEVVEGLDLGKRDLERKIGEFSDALEGAEVGMLFYAGHGLQVDGRNFIVPVDARLDMPAKLRLEAVPLDDVIDIIEQQAKTSLVFLDACRNNPFARSLGRTVTRSATALPGLAQFDSTRGSFIAFSTAPGSVAMDGTKRNSPFAGALLRHIDKPGQSINDLMIAVRRDVVSETRNLQRPWEQGSLIERFEFVPGAAAAAPPSDPVAPAQQIAALERSVSDPALIEHLLRSYLEPDTADMRKAVARVYGPSVTIFGTPFEADALVKIKTDWFAQFASWTLTMEPGSLTVTPRGERGAEAVLAMAYNYVPRDEAAPRLTGKARVSLELVHSEGGWRIVSERSEPLK